MGKKPFFSIVVPTYNEEEYLPKLLKSLSRQTFKNFEVIVSDADSEDKTVEIAKKFGAKVIKGPRKGPGAGRNLGAKKAKGDWLIFFDADVILKDKKFFEKTYKIIKNENDLVGGTFKISTHDGDKATKELFKISSLIMQSSYKLGVYFAPGFATIVNKKAFDEVNGFREDLEFNEDHDLVKRIGKLKKGKLKFIKQVTVYSSSRRFNHLGIKETLKQYLLPTVEYFINGSCKKRKFVPSSELLKR